MRASVRATHAEPGKLDHAVRAAFDRQPGVGAGSVREGMELHLDLEYQRATERERDGAHANFKIG